MKRNPNCTISDNKYIKNLGIEKCDYNFKYNHAKLYPKHIKKI